MPRATHLPLQVQLDPRQTLPSLNRLLPKDRLRKMTLRTELGILSFKWQIYFNLLPRYRQRRKAPVHLHRKTTKTWKSTLCFQQLHPHNRTSSVSTPSHPFEYHRSSSLQGASPPIQLSLRLMPCCFTLTIQSRRRLTMLFTFPQLMNQASANPKVLLRKDLERQIQYQPLRHLSPRTPPPRARRACSRLRHNLFNSCGVRHERVSRWRQLLSLHPKALSPLVVQLRHLIRPRKRSSKWILRLRNRRMKAMYQWITIPCTLFSKRQWIPLLGRKIVQEARWRSVVKSGPSHQRRQTYCPSWYLRSQIEPHWS